MAEQHHKSEDVSTKVRCYTVGYIRDSRKFQPSPSITLKGHWLEEAGFATGQPVKVTVERGQLIIRLAVE